MPSYAGTIFGIAPGRTARPLPALDRPTYREPGGRFGSGFGIGSLLTAWALIAWSIALRDGRFGLLPLALVGLAFLIVVRLALRGRPPAPPRALRAVPDRIGRTRRPIGAGVPATAAVSVLLIVSACWWRTGYTSGSAMLTVSHLLTITAALATAVSVLPGPRQRPSAYRVTLTLAVAAAVTMVIASPAPQIDVWYLLQGSSDGLAGGADMYRQHWSGSPGLYAVYPYLPFTTVLLAPFHWLLSDVRYGEILALALASVWIRGLAGSARDGWLGGRLGEGTVRTPAAAALLPLLVIVLPKSTFAIQQAWTEPLLIAALAGMVLAVRRGRHGWAVVAFAVALASKQHVTLLLPIAAAWPQFGPRRTAAAAGAALAGVAPWLLADPVAFWHDAVSVNLGYRILPQALDIPALGIRHGLSLGFLPVALLLGTAYLAYWRALRHAGEYGFALGAATVILGLDLANKQSFFNHYTLAMGLLAIAAAALVAGRTGEPAGSGSQHLPPVTYPGSVPMREPLVTARAPATGMLVPDRG